MSKNNRNDQNHGSNLLSYCVMDLSNAYNWLWSHSWEKPGDGWEPEELSYAG